MPLDPQVVAFLERYNANSLPSLEGVEPQVLRDMEKGNLNFNLKVEAVKKVENRILPLAGRDIPVRIYTPEGKAPYPALVFYHGGGWVLGSLDNYDSVCRVLTNFAHCVVVSVDYRLAPEHKFPAAVEDAYDSLQWIADHHQEFNINPNLLAVGGDSAGGNLAAVACIIAKERKTPKIAYQLLIYPSTGFKEEPPSMRENSEGYMLTRELMEWFRKHYFNTEEEMQHPYASPIFYPHLEGLPPAMIVTAQYDPLRDVGKAYADKLEEKGVEVTYRNYEGLIHGFINFHNFIAEAQRALEEMAAQLSQALHSE